MNKDSYTPEDFTTEPDPVEDPSTLIGKRPKKVPRKPRQPPKERGRITNRGGRND